MDKILDVMEIIAYEKGLQLESVQNIVEGEILKLAKNTLGEDKNYVIDFDKKDKTIKLFYKLKVVDSADFNSETEITLDSAQNLPNIDSSALHIGDEILLEINLSEIDINRNITSALLKDFEELMDKSLENQIYEQLKSHIGKIVNGMVIFVDKKSEDSIVEIDATRAKLPRKNRIKGERFAVGENISCILKNIYFDKKYGIQIELSRTTPKFLEELLRLEVPEIADGEVSIIKSARIPGVRAKVAVQSNTPRVDAVGATVGVKGVRINAVSKKICGENIDCIEYSPVPEIFVANALSPAKIKSVKIKDEKATITIHSEQKPKVIGKDGVNIRLASMLLGLELVINDIGAENALDSAINTDKTQNLTQNSADSTDDGAMSSEEKEKMFKALFKE
ncbi:transcription termination factor NusA [Helicobacter sp. 23-1045]